MNVTARGQPSSGNHHPQRTRPHASRQQLRPQPPPQLGPQAPQPGAQPGPEATQPPPQPGRHPGPQPGPQRSRPQRSRQQRRPHCTSVMLSIAAVAAVGIGRMGAAWVVTDPPAKMRPAIPIANIVRSIMYPPFLLELTRARHRESHPDPTQNQGLPFHECSFSEEPAVKQASQFCGWAQLRRDMGAVRRAHRRSRRKFV